MNEKRKTKSQERLEGRTILKVVHAPRELWLELDDGSWFIVKAVQGQNSLDPWSGGHAGLDFQSKKPRPKPPPPPPAPPKRVLKEGRATKR